MWLKRSTLPKLATTISQRRSMFFTTSSNQLPIALSRRNRGSGSHESLQHEIGT